jgi:hypothetical protein
MLKRSVAIALATVASIGIAACMSTETSAKPVQIQHVQSSPKVMKLRQVNRTIIKPKYQINAAALKANRTRINANLVGKLNPKFPPFNPGKLTPLHPIHPNGNNNNNNNTNTNTNTNVNNNTNVNTNTNVNANFNGNSSVSVADSASVVGAAAVGTAVVGTAAVAGGPAYYRSGGRSCLTKEYLQTGQILFRDLCTNEWAANPSVAAQ